MKRLLPLLVVLLFGTTAFAQVQRNVVIQEIGTGTWCTYCPGAANGAQQLLTSGANVAIIEYHNGDAFTNAASNARNNYYALAGYPTAHFDGTLEHEGGQACPTANVYSSYQPLYTNAYAVPSPLVLDISGINTGNVYNVVVSIKKLAVVSGTSLKLHLVLTETNITTPAWPGSSGCMTSVHDVERLMAPDYNGTDISFATGDMQIVNLQFTKDAAWVLANCELIAFVQDNDTKTIYNGIKVPLNALPAPVTVNFTGTPLTGCVPVTVNFTDASTGVTNYQWTCTGGTPASPSVANPSVTYNTAGSFDVTLVAWNSANNRGNKLTRTAYVNPSGIPAQAAVPYGNTLLCADPPDGSYSTTAVTGATSYTWDIQPASAGTITPSGTTCMVNWSSTFLGTASLKVKAVNSCGEGAWSNILSITVSTPPSVPGTPTGTSLLCINSNNTTYTTSGATNAGSYFWELLPTTAGTVTGTTNTCTIDWALTYTGTATLKVKGINNGCEGPWSANLDITIDEGPSVYQISGGGNFCETGSTGLPVGLNSSQTGVNYTLVKNGTPTSTVVAGTGSSITFGDQPAGTYTVSAQNALSLCTGTMNGSAVITSDPQAPGMPETPQGPASPNAGTSTDYTTTGGQYATTYTWTVTPAEAGTFSGNTTTGSIDWNVNYTGPAQVAVTGVNSCGNGTVSTGFQVNVLPAVGISRITKTFALLTPNPAKGNITLKAAKGTYNIKVNNSLGKEVMNVVLSGSSAIDISKLGAGVYFFTIDNGTAVQVSKVIITE